MYFIAGPTESDCLQVIPCQNPSESLTICIILTIGNGWERPTLISAYCVSLFRLNLKKKEKAIGVAVLQKKNFKELWKGKLNFVNKLRLVVSPII